MRVNALSGCFYLVTSGLWWWPGCVCGGDIVSCGFGPAPIASFLYEAKVHIKIWTYILGSNEVEFLYVYFERISRFLNYFFWWGDS